MKKNRLALTFFCLFFLGLAGIITKASAADEITIHLSRDFGSENKGYISGTFTLTAKGTNNIVKIAAYFNGTQVAINPTGAELKFQFVTDDYLPGEYNITVKGWDATGKEYQTTLIRTFEKSTPTWIIILILVGVFGLIITGILIVYKKQKKQAKAPAPSKDDVKIELDKQLL